MFKYPIIKISISLSLGIVAGFNIEISPLEIGTLTGVTLLFLIASFLRARKILLEDNLLGISTLVLFLFLGVLITSLHLPINQPTHYLHHLDENNSSHQLLRAQVVERLKPGPFQERYFISAEKLGENSVSGKILLNVQKDSLLKELIPGDRIAVPANLELVKPALNPFEFNYQQFLRNLGVERQLSVNKNQIHHLSGQSGFLRTIHEIHQNINAGLKTLKIAKEDLAVMQALLLGQRQEISSATTKKYADAGVIHILAISGLHVGILLLFLNWILNPLGRTKYGKFIKTVILILLLWSFAVFSGLSPSVLRAVSMFSFLAIGMQLKRRTSLINLLFASLLTLLVINPHYILQVGFQLSYLAVFSIILIQPYLSRLIYFENRILRYFYGILTVSTAAQIGVLPLSLYYFHQFPGLFLLSNLIIIPFLGILLISGLCIILLLMFKLLPTVLGSIYGELISNLNSFITWIASLENFLFRDVYISLLTCLSLYLLIIGIFLVTTHFSYKRLQIMLIGIIAFQFSILSERNGVPSEEFVVFHKSRNSILAEKVKNDLKLYSNIDSLQTLSFINVYKNKKGIEENHSYPLVKNIFNIKNNKVLIIDSSGAYNIPDLNPEVIILINSPKINLTRIIQILRPKLIVADGNNYRTYVNRWKQTAENKKLPFHYTGEKGALILDNSFKLSGTN